MYKYINEMIKHPQFHYKSQLYLSITPFCTWLTSRSTLITNKPFDKQLTTITTMITMIIAIKNLKVSKRSTKERSKAVYFSSRKEKKPAVPKSERRGGPAGFSNDS